MRRREERNQDFEAVRENLFKAGVSVVQAAKAHEEMFHTSLEALIEAVEVPVLLPENHSSEQLDLEEIAPLLEKLIADRCKALTALDIDAYLEISGKLTRLKSLSVDDLELEARKLEAKLRIQKATQLLNQESSNRIQNNKNQVEVSSEEWTEKSLKAKYKTLKKLEQELGIRATTWQDAVSQSNQKLGL